MKPVPGSLAVLTALIAAVSSLPATAAAPAPAPAPAVTTALVATLRSSAQTPAAKAKFALPDGAGKEPAERVCGACHSPSVFTKLRHDQAGWTTVVNQMIAKGADGSDDDFAKIVAYLTANFGPDVPLPAGTTPPPAAPATPPASR